MQDKIRSLYSSSPPPTPNEIEAYLSGRLTEEEKKAFEKRLESTELYSEGIEGIEILAGKGALSKITNELHGRIDRKIEEAERFNYMPYLTAAAMLVLICGLVFTFFRYQSQQSEIAHKNETPSMVHADDLHRLSSADKKAEPTGQVLKQSSPPSPPTEIAMNAPIINADDAPTIEAKESFDDASLELERIQAPKYSPSEAANEKLSMVDNREIYSEMLAFAEIQIKDLNQIESEEESITTGYSSKSKPTRRKMFASPQSDNTAKKEVGILKDTLNIEKPALAVTQLSLRHTLNNLKEENLDAVEQQLSEFLIVKSSDQELVQWLEAMLHLKKNNRTKAIIILDDLQVKQSKVGIEARRLLAMLRR